MHDPDTQAFVITWPWPKYSKAQRLSFGHAYHEPIITIWHHDPCKRGMGDDSCGWFMRSHHGDPKVLAKIASNFESYWDNTWSRKLEDHDPDDGPFEPKTYFTGYFKPDGSPYLSPIGITINLFIRAAQEVFGSWDGAYAFTQKHLIEILYFAENPTDSLHDSIIQKFGSDGIKRKERIASMASCIYGWILRKSRPWYRHPRWHFWHWHIQVHPWEKLKRMTEKCATCGEHFGWGEVTCSDCRGLHCNACSGPKQAKEVA